MYSFRRLRGRADLSGGVDVIYAYVMALTFCATPRFELSFPHGESPFYLRRYRTERTWGNRWPLNRLNTAYGRHQITVRRYRTQEDATSGSSVWVAITGVRLVATDVMVFAGIDLDDAVRAVREGILEQRIAVPARERRFGRLRRWLSR